MSLIYSRPTWRLPPPGTAKLNPTAPASNRILALLPLNGSDIEIVGNRRLVLAAGGSYKSDNKGLYLRGAGSACASIALDLSAHSKISVSFWLNWDAFGSNDFLAMEFTANANSNNGFFVDPNSSAVVGSYSGTGFGFANGSAGGNGTVIVDRPTAATWHHVAVNLDRTVATGVPAVYFNGISKTLTQSASALPNAAFANSTLYLFSRNNASLFGSGRMQSLVIRSGLMSASEVLAEYQRPQSLYAQPARRLWVGVPAAAGTAALTGVSGTGAAGTLKSAISQALTGTAGTGAVGTLAPSVAQALTGVQATGAVGTLAGSIAAALTGTSATGSVGSLTSAVSRALTGAQATGAVGTPTSAVSYALTGVQATGAVGTVSPQGSVTAALSGVAATASVGTMTAAISQAFTGTQATGAVGNVTHGVAYALTGVQATGAAGSLSVVADITVALTGVGATGSVGNLAAAGGEEDARRYTGAGPRQTAARVNGRLVVGTKRQIEELLQRLAAEHAEEDEERVEQGKPPEKRLVKLVSARKAEVVSTPQAAETRVEVPAEAAVEDDEAQRIYEQAYAAYVRRVAIQRDDVEVSGLAETLRKRRLEALRPLLAMIEGLR